MLLDVTRCRRHLKEFDLPTLFVEELGWDRHASLLEVQADGQTFTLNAVAQKRGMVAFSHHGRIPDYAARRKIEYRVARSVHEHLIIYTDTGETTQVWQWIKREPGKPTASREHTYHREQPGDALIQKLQALAFSLEEEENLTLVDVTSRIRAAFDIERVTKRFYDTFKDEHAAFLDFIKGIPDDELHRWYASVMLNRLMFVYFIQKKGFLNGDPDYLRNKLAQTKGEGKNRFYAEFLCPLFFEGFANKAKNRSADTNKLLGKVPYLNGGIFQRHQIEELHGETIKVADAAFEKLFDFFDQYQWHLDERPLRRDNEINPDVLGYIFEKYINQKQMGAYYTKEDITGYNGMYTIIPFLFEVARAKCKVAFEGENSVWKLLQADPDRYIYAAVKKGVDLKLPAEIAAGIKDVSKRSQWNKPAPAEYALPTEIWREVVARRQRYEEVRKKLADGDITDINDFITYNLDIRQFAQDVIENAEPDLLSAFYAALLVLTVLDPTCGSGAFLFAALNILYPLYEACLNRMALFVEEWERTGSKAHPNYAKNFKAELARLAAHHNEPYFILKTIIVNNLYGVDIMDEAVEICKLRLFLKLVAQVESADDIEPLPDIDFNIRAGNTLVGFATYDEVKRAVTSQFDFENAMAKIEDKAALLQSAFEMFRRQQTELGGEVTPADKRALRQRLESLEAELNRYLATDYGVPLDTRPSALDTWLHSHKPFHWFIEFYGIMKRGGFDVIIGNPPYLEYSKVTEYRVRNYATISCANLYVFTVERAFALISSAGRTGVIIPISVACSGAIEPLRSLLVQTSRSMWLSHYSNRPSQLFTGAQNRLTILLTSGREGQPQKFSTRYHRWDARNGERKILFPALQYQPWSSGPSIFHGLLQKVGCLEAATILARIRSNRNVAFFTSKQGRHRIYWVRVPGYFCQFLIDAPMARPEKGGPARIRGEVIHVCFGDEHTRNVVQAVLNSSLYYLFFCAFTDTRHINPSDVAEFPLDVGSFAAEMKNKLNKLSLRLTKCFEANTTQWRKSGLLIDSVDSKPSKPIIDEIDQVLAGHYGLRAEELDFVINYDIKYRLCRAAECEKERTEGKEES